MDVGSLGAPSLRRVADGHLDGEGVHVEARERRRGGLSVLPGAIPEVEDIEVDEEGIVHRSGEDALARTRRLDGALWKSAS